MKKFLIKFRKAGRSAANFFSKHRKTAKSNVWAFLRNKKFLIALAVLMTIVISTPLVINGIVLASTSADIREIVPEDGYDTALVLGAKVHPGGSLSHMLRDRMDTAIALYHAGSVKKLLVSGDGSGEWSETEYMKRYAMENGVAEEDILTDGEGFSTYESVFRAKEEYHLEKFVIVTQKYHLYRALYIADDMEIDALGADASLHSYSGQWYREIREILARCKDFAVCIG